MTPKPEIQTRIRRLSRCYLHPTEPFAGFCASCLRDRLSILDPSGQPPLSPELRRTKSVSVPKCGPSSLSSEPRRKSCDVRAQKTLAYLFNLDDIQKNKPIKEPKVESKNIPISKLTATRTAFDSDQNGENVEEEELKTMQELIDLEFLNKKKKIGEIRANLASIFGNKLRKWDQKQKMKKQSEIVECGFGRRSCDTDPRYSFAEARASWDGYLIASTIPRLTPMLSVVDNVSINRIENHRFSLDGKMQAIHEDDANTTSGDSSSSQRRSSFDRSTSSVMSKKTLGLEVAEANFVMNSKVSPANVDDVFRPTKLVITERELKSWSSNSLKDDHPEKVETFSKDVIGSGDNSNGFKKSARWRKVWAFINRFGDNQFQDFTANVIDQSVSDEVYEKQTKEGDGVVKGVCNGKLVRSSSCVGSRNSRDMAGSTYQGIGNGVENSVCAKKRQRRVFAGAKLECQVFFQQH